MYRLKNSTRYFCNFHIRTINNLVHSHKKCSIDSGREQQNKRGSAHHLQQYRIRCCPAPATESFVHPSIRSCVLHEHSRRQPCSYELSLSTINDSIKLIHPQPIWSPCQYIQLCFINLSMLQIRQFQPFKRLYSQLTFHIIRTCLMYHAASKVEFQPFTRPYSQLTFFTFFLIKSWKTFFIKSWKTSAVSTTVWMVETQRCKLRGTSDAFV